MSGGAGAALRQLARKAEEFPRKFVKGAVADTRKASMAALKADTGGDAAMSGIGGAKLKIKTSVKGGSIVTGEVRASTPRAAWFWLEEGTRPHIAGGKFKGARHPGTRGKRTWSRTVDPSLTKASKRAREELTAMVQGR
jgi:hypothetical protein